MRVPQSRRARNPFAARANVVLLLACGMAGLAGCARPSAPPVSGYMATILTAGGIAGQPGKFHCRVRIRRVDGAPLPDLRTPEFHQLQSLVPDVWITQSPAGRLPGPTYSTRWAHSPGQRFYDVILQGAVSPPFVRPVRLTLDLVETREVPLWRRLLDTHSSASYGEVATRTRLGSFWLRPRSQASAGRTASRSLRQR